VRLAIVPQLGGRLMQVTFGGHSYLFVNPQYKGKYFPPSGNNNGKWFNYGGDKLWPLPEGRQDEQHWAGPASDLLDDGEYQLTVLSHDSTCAVRLDGPADPVTGLQYSREISIGSDSPQISFLAAHSTVMGIRLSGSFGVFYPGKLIAHFYDAHGVESRATPLLSVDPAIAVELEEELEVPPTTERVSIHLIDDDGKDRGSLGESGIVNTN